jgi:hypothetical protein
MVDTLVANNPRSRLDANVLINQFNEKRNLVSAIESYLMAHRGEVLYQEYVQEIELLVSQTLAYSMADENERTSLLNLFLSVAQFIEELEPDPESQALYSKTLLSVKNARNIETWVHENSGLLIAAESNNELLDVVWEILISQIGSKFATTVEPSHIPKAVAKLWISGSSYQSIYNYVVREEGTKPWGATRRRKLNYEDIFSYCEHTLGFDFPLGLAAITEFLAEADEEDELSTDSLMLLQKSMKYGVAEKLAISCYEFGVADRMLSQKITTALQDDGYEGLHFIQAMDEHGDNVRAVMVDYPEYFNNVLSNLV